MGLAPLDNLAPVLTLADAKAHLRLDTTDEDGHVEALVLAATDWLEARTNLTLTPRRFRLTLGAWPADGTVLIPRPPLVEVESVTIDDVAVYDFEYAVDADATPGRVTLLAPTPPAGRAVITYAAGHATPPPALAHAARLLVGGWFLNREAAQDRTVTNLPSAVAVESIVNTYRLPFAGGHEP